MRAGRAGLMCRAPVSSRARYPVRDQVVEHGAVDDVGEASLEAAHGLVGGLPGSDLAVVVGAALGGVSELNDGHHVQHHVDLPVPAA